jgi:hypothetical protein
MFWQFDHRSGTYEGQTEAQANKGLLPQLSVEKHKNPFEFPRPRYWVREQEVIAASKSNIERKWQVCWRDVTSAVLHRTVIAAIVPLVATSDSAPIANLSDRDSRSVTCFVANLNAFVLDYLARQKLGGSHLRFFTFEQLPVLPPHIYEQPCVWSSGQETLQVWLFRRVLELTYTAWDLESFAEDCCCSGPPFRWDEERRFLLRCELDAAFFHLYLGSEEAWRKQSAALIQAFATPRAAVSYIMDTFPIVKRKDEARTEQKNPAGEVVRPGRYITKDTILEIYDALAEAMQTGKAYQTRLNPAPASIAVAHLPRFDRERVNFKEAGDYILPFVASLLRHQGSECDVMILIRAYAMLLADRKTLTALTEARFGAEAGAWVKRFNQPVDASWFLPILRGLDNRDVIKLDERGENDVFVGLLDASVPSNSTVETDVYLLLHVLDLNAVPPTAVAEQMKRISPKTIRTSLHEAKLVTA